MSEESAERRDAMPPATETPACAAGDGAETFVQRWTRRLAEVLVMVVYGLGAGMGVHLFSITFKALGVHPSALIAMLMAYAAFAIAVALHELGHALAACAVGLTPTRARWLGFECIRRRRGWSIRWHRAKGQPLGLIFAFPLGPMPGRKGFMAFIAAGPLVNLASAAIAMAFAFVDGVGVWTGAFLGFALIQAVPGIASLIPTVGHNYPSDGHQLLRWWRGVPDDEPTLAFLRLNGLSYAGATAGELPEQDLRILETAPIPFPLVADMWRLMAARDRDDAEAVDATIRRIEARIETLADAERTALDDLLAVIRCETAFCTALFRGVSQPLEGCAVPPPLRWYVPQFEHRLEALRAAMRGDREGCRNASAAYAREAESSFDAGDAAGVPTMVASIERALARTLARRQGDLNALPEAPPPTTSTTVPGIA